MLRNVDAAICVSYIGYEPNTFLRKPDFHRFRRRENTVLRANLPPKSVYVIPNAIVADHFFPAPSRRHTDISPCSRSCPARHPLTSLRRTVTIIVVSRLAYRKGVDLLVATAPRICAAFPNVRFVVGELSHAFFVISLITA
jgi:phosphatidylinositol glycan class A protein